MNKELEAWKRVRESAENADGDAAVYEIGDCDIIEKELKDYQEIKEIAKRYNWDDITGKIFNVETDRKYRDLFNSAIVNIQEDYRKARALEIIKNKGVFAHLLQQSQNMKEYNTLMLVAFKKMAEKDYKGAVEKFCLTQGEFDFLKKVLL